MASSTLDSEAGILYSDRMVSCIALALACRFIVLNFRNSSRGDPGSRLLRRLYRLAPTVGQTPLLDGCELAEQGCQEGGATSKKGEGCAESDEGCHWFGCSV